MTETTKNRWYTRRSGGEREGSFSDEELAALIRQGIVKGQDEIWTLAMKDWMRIEDTIYSFYLPQEQIRPLDPIEIHPEKDADPQLEVLKIRSTAPLDELHDSLASESAETMERTESDSNSDQPS